MPRLQPPTVPSGEAIPQVVIPPLRERPLSAEEGPKIVVKRFELEGVADRPGLINADEVKELVESQRQKWSEGMTLGQLQLVADEVTSYYRSHGLILAKAYIGAQQVTDAVVRITVLEGKFGTVHSNKSGSSSDAEKQDDGIRYPEKLLEKPFAPLKGEAVVQEPFESALLQLFDYPGLKYNAVIKPGAALGTADLHLNITEERLFDAALSFDNYGSKYTGEYRPRLDILLNNPTNAADRLGLTLMDTIDPHNDFYWGANYERPLPWGHNFIGFEYSRNAFDVGDNLSELELTGMSETRDMYFKHFFKRNRSGSVSGLLRFASITAETRQFEATTGKDDLSVLSAETQVTDYMDHFFGGGVSNLNVSVYRGLEDFLGSNDNDDPGTTRTNARGEKAPADFTKITADYSRLQKLWTNASLLVRLKGQAADSMLVSVEQFPLGGPDTVRAYQQAEYMMDQGYFASAELILNAPGFSDRPAFANRTWGELLQFSLFYDTASGWLKNPLPSEEKSGYLSGAGIGVHFALPGRFSANVSVAKPVGSHDSEVDRDYFTYFKIVCQY